MRRFLAIVLLSTFLLQSTGSAAAAAPAGGPPSVSLAAMFVTRFAAIDAAFRATPIFAILSGNMNAYALIHAAAPDFTRIPRAMLVSPSQSRAIAHVVGRPVGRGTFVRMALLREPSFSGAHRVDPLSTRAQAARSRNLQAPGTKRGAVQTLLIHKGYVVLSPSSISGAAGSTATVTITCYAWNLDNSDYEEASCPTLTITSSNASVATMDSSGTVTLVSVGNAGITVTPTLDTPATLSVTVTAAATPTPAPTATPAPTPCPPGWSGIAPNCTSPTPTPQPTTTPGPPLTTSTTGINPWWTYEEGGIAGAGKWMLNVATGNLLVQDDDIDVHERAIDLAFRRTYNSQSAHDYANSDGSVPSNYGNGWTNTFDAHMAYNAASGELSVYDIDGARYDYCPDGSGGWKSCANSAGMHNTLVSDTGCGYFWTKKNGTTYYFWGPVTVCPGLGAAYLGRLYLLRGRNHNNWIRFDYSWTNGDSSSSRNLASIAAVHADGQQLTLQFADFGGNRLLASVTRPDGQAVTYQYDPYANLTDVFEIGNDAATNATPIHHQYAWNANHQMWWGTSPNWTAGNPHPGSYDAFSYDGANRVTQVQSVGIMNFTPSDGTGVALQPNVPTTGMIYRNATLTYTSGQTTYADTDRHATIYTYDAGGRETTRQTYNGSAYLVTSETWDGDNNLTSTVDPRGAATGNPSAYQTDYQYDASGDAVAVALPPVATNVGTIRPTSLYSYDQFHNITSACDSVFANGNGLNWTSRPAASDTLCPSAPGTTRYQYDYSDQNEPYGRLNTAESPCYNSSTCTHAGSNTTYAYSTSAQGGDYGLPSGVTDACFTQYDSSQVCSTRQLVYDNYGNLTSYNPGNGVWTLTYDTLNRPTAASDADGVTSYKCYFDDGSLRATQTPVQHTADGGAICGSNSVAYTYDYDGNKLTELHHFQNTLGTTTNWYDGDDRLVEVQLPHDASDYYSYNWMTRSIYDLSQGQALSANGAGGIYGSGNLYESQEWQGSWLVLKADAYDPMDRNVGHYQWQSGTSNFTHDSTGYDQVNTVAGFLSSRTNALGEVAYYNYDAAGHTTQTSYANDGGVTPAESMTYDPDGRAAAVQSSTMGTQSSTYDQDGFVRTVQEPNAGGITSAATYTYDYYPGGMRKALSVASSSLTQSNMLQYAYREDGLRTKLTFADGSTSGTMTWGRSAAGRVQTIADTSGQATHTITHNFEGMVTQDQMASGTISGFTWDNEGEITGFTDPAGMTATIAYTVRGELRQQYFGANCTSPTLNPPANPEYGSITEKSANGYMKADDCQSVAPGVQWDAHTSAGLGNDTSTYSYDSAGRQTSTLVNWTRTTQCGDQTCTQSGQDTYTKAYDAENHLIGDSESGGGGAFDNSSMALRGCLLSYQSEKQTYDPPSSGGPYAWGPNGHPAIMSGLSVHWDGDTPLFVTDAAGALKEVKIETAAYYAPGSPLKYLDRNQSGFVVAAHWSGGHTAYTPADSMHQTCDSQDFSGAVLYEPGIDGLSDGVNIIQGVRAYNPGTGQWSSPDVYQGDIRDPMSQKSFMWNNNNPFSYTDPSGYAVEAGMEQEDIPPADPAVGSGYMAAQMRVVDDQIENGNFSKSELQALADNPNAPDFVRGTAQSVLDEKYPTKVGSTNGRTGRFSPSTRASGLNRFCSACRGASGSGQMEGDHVIPSSRGGGNTMENFDTLCRVCNASKNAQTPQQWIRSLILRHGP